jgi:hypothetical protein
MFVFKNLHFTRSFYGPDHDLIASWNELIEDPLGQTKSPIAFPTPELLPVVERDGVGIAVIAVKVSSKLVEVYGTRKTPRERYNT